ncbi:myosin-binding protein 1 isoform X2 [Silene latifolia]|uniref:myosin-binding protein 1 isoform X2 n=1 Tax=Silene latifolia TaxID=37657 RepID=UPI003D7772C0
MGGKFVSSSKLGKFGGSFTAVLASALLEWLLIFMLIVYALFGYLITKFARYCELPIPCLLCSRIDNILGGEKPGFYWDMICGNHKLDISSLVYCHFHEKLVDVRGMCETCLFSFATKDKSNAETYRLLVGKLGEKDLSGYDEGTSFDDNHVTETLKHCSCCNELWNPRRHPQTLFQTKSTGGDVSLSREASRDLDSLEKDAMKTPVSSTIIHVREMTEDYSLEKEANKTQASSTIIHVKEKIEDPLAHFGFTELKISSDTESDIQASDIHDSLEEANKTQASSTIIDVREKIEDPLAHVGFTELKISSDTESDIQDSLEKANKTQASSRVIHVREKIEDPLSHIGFTELKISSDTESDIQASDIHDSLEEANKIQAASTIIHVREKIEDPLAHIGFTELKISSDTESDLQASDMHDSLEEAKKSQASSTIIHVIEKTEDHFGFTELKLTSDTESDIQISDLEDPLRDLILESTEVTPFISISEDASASEKPNDRDVLSRESSPISRDLELSDIIRPRDSTLGASSPAIGHGLEELNWQDIDHTPRVGESKEMINVIDDIPNPLVSTEMIGAELLPNIQNGVFISVDSAKVDAKEATVEAIAHVSDVTDKNQDLENLQPTTNLNSSEMRSDHTDGDVQTPNYLELSDAYKLAVSSRGRQLSEKLSEQLAGKNSSGTNLDLKLLLSQFSRGLNLPSTGILSPRVSRNFDELKTDNSSASITMKLLQKRASLERNDSRNSLESAYESLDFSTVGEMEGESEVDRLKRQLEHDRRFLIALLKELEEERNASASATNEAMAMITRLQEEKAALQMEASHHLRMMEEQAEYDMDALDKLNELVTEKEKEIQNLEEELDYYRVKYPNELIQDDVGDPHSNASPHDPWLVTQEEREYLSKCLRKLEEKLSLFNEDGENSFDLISEDAGHEVKGEMESNSLVTKESLETLVKQSKSSGIHKDAETASIVNEVSRLNERLQILEADRTFIEHAIKALNDGQEELIQEIASHLRELHKVGIKRYRNSFEDKDVL